MQVRARGTHARARDEYGCATSAFVGVRAVLTYSLKSSGPSVPSHSTWRAASATNREALPPVDRVVSRKQLAPPHVEAAQRRAWACEAASPRPDAAPMLLPGALPLCQLEQRAWPSSGTNLGNQKRQQLNALTSDPMALLHQPKHCVCLLGCTVISANDAVSRETKSPLLKG